jgi:hypothetical protein
VFTENGFEVTVKGYEVKISWFKQYFKNRGWQTQPHLI